MILMKEAFNLSPVTIPNPVKRMATITEVKQKIIDKIDKLLDNFKGMATDDASIKADKGKMELIDLLIAAHNNLGDVFEDDGDADDDPNEG